MIKINYIIYTSPINIELFIDKIISSITWFQVDKDDGISLITCKLPYFSTLI